MEWPKIPISKLKRQLDRIGTLKQKMVTFGIQEGWFTRIDPLAEDAYMEMDDIMLGREDLGFLDDFEALANLTRSEREIVDLWYRDRPFLGIFELRTRRGLMLHAHNLIDELDYPLTGSAYEVVGKLPVPSFIATRIAPTPYGYWVMSGAQQLLGDREEAAYEVAAMLSFRLPRLRLRNPALRQQAIEIIRENHEAWLGCFGVPYVIGGVAEVEAAMQTFRREMVRIKAEERGEDPVEVGDAALMPDLEEEFDAEHQMGIVHHPVVGFMVGQHVPRVLELVRDPGLAEDPDKLDEMGSYFLEQEDGPPFGLMIMADEHPQEFTTALRLVLDDPSFDWERDGEALMREHYEEFDEECYPRTIPLDGKLLQGFERSQARSIKER